LPYLPGSRRNIQVWQACQNRKQLRYQQLLWGFGLRSFGEEQLPHGTKPYDKRLKVFLNAFSSDGEIMRTHDCIIKGSFGDFLFLESAAGEAWPNGIINGAVSDPAPAPCLGFYQGYLRR